MERYVHIAGLIVTIVAFVFAFFFCVRAAIHFVRMQTEYRSRRHDVAANVVPFMVLFLPRLFTEQGNLHRRRFLADFGRFLGCGLFIAAMYALLGI